MLKEGVLLSESVQREKQKSSLIQVLRAFAVGSVVVFHLWPGLLPGGFVGVDIFFVLSGFLITQAIFDSVKRSAFSFKRFYLRRFRRLFPAAFLVVVVSWFTFLLFGPRSMTNSWGQDATAAIFGFVNWLLVSRSTDYFNLNSLTGPYKHFWSLSVEEQTYLFWPVAIVLLFATALRYKQRVEKLVFGGILLIGLGSFIWSLITSATVPNYSYLDTLGRTWEFSAGALIVYLKNSAMWKFRLARLPKRFWIILSSPLLVGSIFFLPAGIGFPAPFALFPVIGTCLFIVGAIVEEANPQTAREGWLYRFVTRIGDFSYGIYLWHWPLIILWPYISGISIQLESRVLILVIAVIAGAFSFHFIEVPIQKGLFRPFRRDSIFVPSMLITTMIFGATLYSQLFQFNTEQSSEIQQLKRANSRLVDCTMNQLRTGLYLDCRTEVALLPSSRVAAEDEFLRVRQLSQKCQIDFATPGLHSCLFGEKSAEKELVLAGDSHAAQWLPAFDLIGKAKGYRVVTYLRSGCPVNILGVKGFNVPSDECLTWSREVVEKINGRSPTLIFLAASTNTVYNQAGAPSSFSGFAETLSSFSVASLERIVVIRDTPNPITGGILDVPSCLDRQDAAVCALERVAALPEDPLANAAHFANRPVIDFSKNFCEKEICQAVIEKTLVYRDGSHITQSAALKFTLPIWRQIEALISGD